MELWARNCPVILPKFRLPLKFRDLLHAANLRHGTDGFTSPPKEGFFRPKNPTASSGFEPANLGTKGQHATPRPPKPLSISYECCKFSSLCDKYDISRLEALPSALNVSVYPVCDIATTHKSPVF